MKIIIAGAGEVGLHLAKLLSYESQNITLIDIDKDTLEEADQHLDIRVLRGNASSISLLKEAGVADSDMVVAVTSSESVNITICTIAKQLGAKKTIARISDAELFTAQDEVDFKAIGVDELISPEYLAAAEVSILLNQNVFTDSYKFDEGALTMVGLTLQSHSSFVGKTVQEISEGTFELEFVLVIIQKISTGHTLIPRGDTILHAGDQLYFTTTEEGVPMLYKALGQKHLEMRDVMILGASEVGFQAAKDLSEKNLNVKLIERNKELAFEVAVLLPNCLVIHGDGRNIDLLLEESIDDMDAFVALTENSETNIMSCLLAKSRGVKKTMALVENIDYFKLLHSIGIDTIINKKLLASNSIFKYVRRGQVVSIAKLSNTHAEILEFRVSADSKVCNKYIKDIRFPRAAIIGGVIRNGVGIITLGNFKIQSGDRVLVCTLPEATKKVEKLFK